MGDPPSAFDRAVGTAGKCDGYNTYREWGPKLRQAIGLYKPKMLDILDGAPRPNASTHADDAAEWGSNNNKLFGVLYFATTGSAHLTVKEHMSKNRGEMGNGVAAWNALHQRFDGNTKEARRKAREELFNMHMEDDSDPQDFFFKTDHLRARLMDMGETISDEVYESLLIDALSKPFEFIKHRHFENPSLGIDSIKNTAINFYIDKHSRQGSSIAGRGTAMTATSGEGKDSCCKACGHCQRSGTQNKGKWKKGKKDKDSSQKWCSLHKTTSHSDSECFKQKELENLKANLALLDTKSSGTIYPEIGSAYVAHGGPEPKGKPVKFGFSFCAISKPQDEVTKSSNTSDALSALSARKPAAAKTSETSELDFGSDDTEKTHGYRGLPAAAFGAF